VSDRRRRDTGGEVRGGRGPADVRPRRVDEHRGRRVAGQVQQDGRRRVRRADAKTVRRSGQGTGSPDAPVPDERPANAHPSSDTPGSRARANADVPVRRVLETRRRTRDQGAAGEDRRGGTGRGRRGAGRRRPRRRRDATEEDDVRAPVAEVRSGAGRLRERETRRTVRRRRGGHRRGQQQKNRQRLSGQGAKARSANRTHRGPKKGRQTRGVDRLLHRKNEFIEFGRTRASRHRHFQLFG